jgi:hypothetical protein
VTLLINAQSKPYLDDVTIDFAEVNPGESRFVFSKASAGGGCGTGSAAAVAVAVPVVAVPAAAAAAATAIDAVEGESSRLLTAPSKRLRCNLVCVY